MGTILFYQGQENSETLFPKLKARLIIGDIVVREKSYEAFLIAVLNENDTASQITVGLTMELKQLKVVRLS